MCIIAELRLTYKPSASDMDERNSDRKLVILAAGEGKKCTLMEVIKKAEYVPKVELPGDDVPIVCIERIK